MGQATDITEMAEKARLPGRSGAFGTRLEGIFGATNRRLLISIAQVQLEAAKEGKFGNSRLAFRVADVVERELEPAVQEALESYDRAVNRLVPPKARYRQWIKEEIRYSVDIAVQKIIGTSNAFRDPWREPLKAEQPNIVRRLQDLVDQHATGLAPTGIKREYKPWYESHPLIRAARWLAALLIAGFVGYLFRASSDHAWVIKYAHPRPINIEQPIPKRPPGNEP
jgi:hypothetical protein